MIIAEIKRNTVLQIVLVIGVVSLILWGYNTGWKFYQGFQQCKKVNGAIDIISCRWGQEEYDPKWVKFTCNLPLNWKCEIWKSYGMPIYGSGCESNHIKIKTINSGETTYLESWGDLVVGKYYYYKLACLRECPDGSYRYADEECPATTTTTIPTTVIPSCELYSSKKEEIKCPECQLSEGENLVLWKLSDINIEDAVASVKNNLNYIYFYDGSKWYLYDPSIDLRFNTLKELKSNFCYLFYMKNKAFLTFKPTTTTTILTTTTKPFRWAIINGECKEVEITIPEIETYDTEDECISALKKQCSDGLFFNETSKKCEEIKEGIEIGFLIILLIIFLIGIIFILKIRRYYYG